jgi:hypothetical protein
MTHEKDPRDTLQVWHQRLSHIFGDKHPLPLLCRAAIESRDPTIMKGAIEAISSDKSLLHELTAPPKEELLRQYAYYEPAPFWQIDGWHEEEGCHPECDPGGHRVSSQASWELMRGGGIRIFVSKDAPREEVIPLIQELAEQITDMYSQPLGEQPIDETPF